MSTSPTSKARKWASVRKKFNLIVAHRSSSPDRSSSPASTLSAESQAASFCRPYTANPALSSTSISTGNISTTTLEAPPRSPRPVSSPVAFPVHFPPTKAPTPTPTPPPPPPPPQPAAAAVEKKKAKQALLAGEGDVEIDPAEEALLAPTTAAEAEWDRLTKANSEMNNNLDLYGTAGEKSKGMRKRAKSRVGRRKKGVRFSEGEDVIGLGGFEVWTTDEESGGEEEAEALRAKERERMGAMRKELGVEERRKRDMKVEVEVRAVEVKAPPPPPPPRPQSLPASTKRAPPVVPGLALGHPAPKRPPPPPVPVRLSEKRDMSRKMLPPSVRLVQDDGSF